LDEEGFVADPQLIHVMQWLPVLCVQVEQVHLTVSVRVLTANEQYFTVRNGQGAAGPEWVLHTDCEHLPLIFFNFIHFDSIVNLLLSAAKETSKSVNKFISNRAGTQIVSFVLHGSHLVPFVFLDVILFNRAKSLFS
jgi:hypothetical protein